MSELPLGWVDEKLSEIGTIQLGKMLDKVKNKGAPTKYLRNVNVRWGAFDLTDVEEMRMTNDERTRFNVADGDLLICEGGEPGRCAVWVDGPNDLAFQKALLRIRPLEGISSEWVANALKLKSANGDLDRFFTGTTIKHLPAVSLSKVPVPIAPLPEQRRIVAKIEALSARSKHACAELDRVPELVDRAKEALLRGAFDNAACEQGTVSEIVSSIDAGKNVRCVERSPQGNEIGVVKVSAVTWGKFDARASKTFPADFTPPPHTLIKTGDFLFSRANTIELVGACVIVDGAPANLYLSDKILRLNVADENKAWLLWFLRSPLGRSALEAASSGNQLSMRNISQSGLLKIQMPLPPPEIRSTIVNRIETTFTKLNRLAAEARSAAALLDRLDQALLAKAFRGELVPQDPNDEPASVLLERIRASRATKGKPAARRRRLPRMSTGASR